MTLVTTSRKALPEIRALARAFALASRSMFVTRGKMGTGDLFSRDVHIVIFSQDPRGVRVQFFSDETLVADYLIREISTESRAGPAIRGLGTDHPGEFSAISGIIRVSGTEKIAGTGTGCIDGPQKIRYRFRIVPYGA